MEYQFKANSYPAWRSPQNIDKESQIIHNGHSGEGLLQPAVDMSGSSTSRFNGNGPVGKDAYRGLLASAAPAIPRLPQNPPATQSQIKERVVKKRNRKINSCTQCRDRKLRCCKGQPCSRCRDRGEDCIYISKASDLCKVPKRMVKKRKRAINVCWTCRDRKIPCDKGSPCSPCLEAGLQCIYQRYNPTHAADQSTNNEEVQILRVRERDPVNKQTAPLFPFFADRGHPSTSPNGLQKQSSDIKGCHAPMQPSLQAPNFQSCYPDPFLHDHNTLSSSTLPRSNQQPQVWGSRAPFGDRYIPHCEDEGYASISPETEYLRDPAQCLPMNTNFSAYGPSSGYYTTPPRPAHSMEEKAGNLHPQPQSFHSRSQSSQMQSQSMQTNSQWISTHPQPTYGHPQSPSVPFQTSHNRSRSTYPPPQMSHQRPQPSQTHSQTLPMTYPSFQDMASRVHYQNPSHPMPNAYGYSSHQNRPNTHPSMAQPSPYPTWKSMHTQVQVGPTGATAHTYN